MTVASRNGRLEAVSRLAASEFGMAIADTQPAGIMVANESIRDYVMAGRTRILVPERARN